MLEELVFKLHGNRPEHVTNGYILKDTKNGTITNLKDWALPSVPLRCSIIYAKRVALYIVFPSSTIIHLVRAT